MAEETLHVAVIDVGSLSNLGWAVEGPVLNECGADIDVCVGALCKALEIGPLALGFEAPMFVPHGRKRCDLDKGRRGEGDRAFGASVGASVLVKGLMIAQYVLSALHSRVGTARPTFRWREQLSAAGDLLLFEAFVSHVGKAVGHIDCARLALKRFPGTWEERASFVSAIDEPGILNLLGAILLRIGWTDDITVLSEPCLVVLHKGQAGARRSL